MTSFYNNQQIIDFCNVNESEFFHSYLIAYRYHLTSAIPYNVIQFPIYEWIDILMTFSWSFIDLLIILVSVGLATRFNQLNQRIIESGSGGSKAFWTEIRVHYCALIDLTDEIDENISMLMLISVGHNLFSLCVTIFECLTR
jgi:gustatory receptor